MCRMTEYEQIVDAKTRLPQFQKASMKPQDLPLVYQYRNFDSFWKILKSDSFWATNARFSNDEEEQQFGIEVITSLCKDSVRTSTIDDIKFDENYIICFCKEDNKLSQWRGYAPEGGVSMGFDFNLPCVFSVLNSDANDNSRSDDCVIQYVGIDAVRYINPIKEMQNSQEYSKYCRDEIRLTNHASPDEIEKVYKEEIQKKAPFIKHSGFKEENECRLVFHNDNNELDACVRYRDSVNTSIHYPYIVVKAALPADQVKHCVVRVCIQEDAEVELVKKLEAALKTTHPVLVQGCHLPKGVEPDAGEPFCTGCVLRRGHDVFSYQSCRYKYPTDEIEYEYCLHESASCVIVSQGDNQKEVFEVVHNCVEKFSKNNNISINVWCEGHLPLRKITVGPCPNQNNVVEAIRHYCKHTYWLRDVEITASDIPFRKTL